MSKQLNELHKEIALITTDLTAGRLYPYRFFIAWHGVITLAFRRFPDSLLTIKNRLNQSTLNLVPENDGSRWPKMTLAALSPTMGLDKENLSLLNDCCTQFNKRLTSLSPLITRQLTIVHYAQQSLEECIELRQVNLREPSRFSEALPSLQPEIEKLFYSRRGDAQAEKQQKILASGRDISHYRTLNDGVSLVFSAPHVYQEVISLLQHKINRILPHHYEWLKPESRHLTVRALF